MCVCWLCLQGENIALSHVGSVHTLHTRLRYKGKESMLGMMKNALANAVPGCAYVITQCNNLDVQYIYLARGCCKYIPLYGWQLAPSQSISVYSV